MALTARSLRIDCLYVVAGFFAYKGVLFMALLKCKFCKQTPKAGAFGTKYEVFCPSDSRECAYPPLIEASSPEEAETKWNKQFGYIGDDQ